jgi:hypothetical protein
MREGIMTTAVGSDDVRTIVGCYSTKASLANTELTDIVLLPASFFLFTFLLCYLPHLWLLSCEKKEFFFDSMLFLFTVVVDSFSLYL